MHGLELASEEADNLVEEASRSVPPVERNGKTSCFSIHQKLRQLYAEETAKASQQPLQYLRPTSHLLEKLVAREQLNTLVLNLYPGNKGYSLSLQMGEDNTVETAQFPYQEDQLLSYIDNEELPPNLADLLERSHPELYYSGCVIVQVRDYRQTFPHFVCDTHHVLLRPTTQSIINDVNMLTASGEWSVEDRLAVESQLVMANAGPLCLDPNPAVSLVQQRLHHRRHILNTPGLRRAARKHSQNAINRKRKLDQLSAKPLPHLAEFISRRKTQPSRSTARPAHPSTASKQVKKKPEVNTNTDYLSDIQRLAKPLDRPMETIDCTPLLVEEYILETERGPGRVYYIKLSILQRPSNCEYLGQLYVDKEYREGESNGASCRFSLGSRAQANRYIQQFTVIFTEEGRKSVRITHVVPGQPARVICTAGMREHNAKISALAQHQQHTLKQVLMSMSQQQQLKLQKAAQAQKEQQALADVAINGLISSATLHNGPLANGDVAAASTHTTLPVQQPQPQQVSKPVIMTNPAISALANDLKNSVQQYQQQQQAAANAAAAAAAAAAASASSSVNFVNNQATTVTNNHHNNAAILSLLNSNSSSSGTPTLNHLLNNVSKQQVLTARKMTLTNLINPRSIAINAPSNAAGQSQQQSQQQQQPQSVRVSLSSLTNQLSSPPLTQKVSGRLVPAQAVYTNVQSINTANVSGGIRRLSNATSSEASTASSLGLSMPGLSALLAGTPSADNPAPGGTSSNSALLERLSTPPSYPSPSPKPPPAPSPTPSSISLNLASVQGALTSIPGLQNVQVSIPGLAVPISMSIGTNSSSHIVTSLPVTASLPVGIMTSTNLAGVSVSGNSPAATLVLTNSSPVTAQLLAPAKNQASGQTLRTTGTPTTCNIGGQSIQLVGTLQRPRGLVTGTTNKPMLMSRSVINNQRQALKVAPANTVLRTADMSGNQVTSGQVLTLSPHHQIQIQALQKQAQLQLQQFPSAAAAKHQRRRSTADNK